MNLHAGSRRVLFFEAVATLLGTTIGAGILGIPYMVAHVGIGIGLLYLVGVGLVTLVFNILLGEIVVRTRGMLQLTGLARKHLGMSGFLIMSAIFFLGAYSALLAYIIGEGVVLQALFGGSPVVWSLLFFAVGAFFVQRGLKTVKVVELIMTVGLVLAVIVIAGVSAPSITIHGLGGAFHWSYFFLPYGVMLFAYHGSAALPVAHAILPQNPRLLKRAIVLSGLLSMGVYLLFTLVVLGVTGNGTTEVATVGLGEMLGPGVRVLGNVFAFFAMGTSFIMMGTALRETFEWDHRLQPAVAGVLALLVPLALFILGARGFVQVIGVAGAFFISIEIVLVLLMYARVHQKTT